MAVHKYLDCSTSHVTKEENALLEAAGELEEVGSSALKSALPMRVINHNYGWWVHAYDDDELIKDWDDKVREVAPNLLALLLEARKLGCYWINLDSDGEKLEGFPVFDW
jgi:hypothetical protein